MSNSQLEQDREGDEAITEPSLSRDDLFEILSNRRRRYVLNVLNNTPDGEAELSTVVEQIAAWENGTTPDQVSYDDRKSVHISLYQHHAPKMDEAGVISYDQRSGTLELTDEAAKFDVYLATDADRLLPWELYFPALSGVLAVVVALAWAGLLGFAPAIAWAAIAVVAFGASSLAYLYDTRYREADDGDAPPEVGGD